MAKITGNTTATPMAVPDLAQTDERKANYIKNKKISFLENDIGYAEKTYVDNKVGDIDEALNEIIALQEQYIKDSLPDITFYVYGNPYTAKDGTIWKDRLTDTELADTIGYFGTKDDTGIVWVSGDCFQLGLNGIPVLLTDTIVADAYYDGIYN